jgi:hypothetical protein
LITFAELSTQLVNFDDYINKVIGEFEQSSVFKSYIDLSGTEMEDYEGANRSTFIRPLESFVDRLLFNEGRGKLALLGNFGTGTFCRKYAYELATPLQERSYDSYTNRHQPERLRSSTRYSGITNQYSPISVRRQN